LLVVLAQRTVINQNLAASKAQLARVRHAEQQARRFPFFVSFIH
jgi:hypothetical protein